VTVGGVANTVTAAVLAADGQGSSVTLTLTNPVANSASVIVNYTQNTDVANRLYDPAGNAMATFSSVTSNVGVTNETVAPTVTSVDTTSPDATYKVGDTVDLTVTFNEVIYVTGAPRITLSVGDTPRYANYVSGSGTDTLTFTYTVTAGDSSDDLAYGSTSALALNGGTIKDGAGNSAILTLPTPGQPNSLSVEADIKIDGVAPTFTANETDDTSFAVDAGTKTIVLKSEEALSLGEGGTLAADDFTVTVGGVANTVTAAVLAADGQGSSVTLTLTNLVSNSASVIVNYTQNTDVANRLYDPAGNAMATFSSTSPNVGVTNETVPPTVTAFFSTNLDGQDIYVKSQDSINISATMSEIVRDGTSFVVQLNTGDQITLSADGDTTTLSGTYTVGESGYVPSLTVSSVVDLGTVKDLAGNPLPASLLESIPATNINSSFDIVVDNLAPSGGVVSLKTDTDPSSDLNAGDVLTFTFVEDFYDKGSIEAIFETNNLFGADGSRGSATWTDDQNVDVVLGTDFQLLLGQSFTVEGIVDLAGNENDLSFTLTI
jgi:uncharacterized repeat protein (TIGR02059 family)